MKKLIYAFLGLSLLFAPVSEANTKVPAKDVSTNTSDFGNNIPTSADNVQKALKAINDAQFGGIPGGVDRQFQINNQGVFAGGNMYNDLSGNIGVGTEAPASELDVRGTVTADTFVADGQSEINFEPNNQTLRSDKDGWINTNGGIAIGTTNPLAQLEVAGQSTSLPALRLISGSLVSSPVSGALENDGSYIYYSTNALVRKILATTTGVLTSGNCVSIDSSGNFIDAGAPCGSGGGSQWVTNGSDIYYNTGNVAIGTTSPTASLNIVKSGSNDLLKVSSVGGAGGDILFVGSAGNVGIGTTKPNSKGLTIKDSAMVDFAGPILQAEYETSGTNSVSFLRRDVARSTGTTSTNFGIINDVLLEKSDGTLAAAYRDGYQLTDATTGKTEHRMIINNGSTVDTKWIQTGDGYMGFNAAVSTGTINAVVDIFGAGGSGATRALQVRNSALTSKFVVLDNGNVGLGTFAPSSSLNIIKSAGVDLMRLSSVGGAGGDYLIVNSSGNIGINTTGPRNKLEIGGTIQSTGFKMTTSPVNGYVLTSDASGVGTWQAGGGGGVGVGTINPGTAGYITYYPATGTTVDDLSVLYSDGTNVGVGTTTLDEKVTVSGNVKATSFIGNLTGNASTVTTNANLSGDVSSVGNVTTIGAGKVTEAMQVLADNTTNDVSTTKHGYAPKAPNDATKYLDGTGAYSVPAGSGSGPWTDGGTNVYLTTTTDNVAIGTTTPNSTSFEIVKQGSTIPFKISSTASGNGNLLVVSSAGNIGIGSVAPSGMLTVVQPTSNGVIATFKDNGNFVSTTISCTSTSCNFGTATSSGIGIGFNPSGSRAMTLDGAQRVGMGTTLPASRLSVNNNVSIGTSYSTIAAPTNGMLVQGSVGIGSTSPRGAVDTGSGDIYANAVYAGTGSIGQWSSASGIGFDSNSALYTTPEMFLTSAGNLGIGTESPDSLLTTASSGYMQFKMSSAGAPTSGDCDSDSERGRLSIDTTNNRLYICNGASRAWDYVSLTD